MKNSNKTPKTPASQKAQKEMIIIIILCIVSMLLYFTGTQAIENVVLNFITMGVFMLALAVFAVVYIAYNYAFTRKDVTPDMLPASWSEEKKQDYIGKAREHKEKSRWMIFVIFPLIVTFIADVLYLYIWTGFLETFFLNLFK